VISYYTARFPVRSKALEVLGKELDVTMALCGVKSVREIGRRLIAQL
jgi:isopentenyl diphosphate isomerase/L-lactate dehydrogenase-like FMN-dependent dehydrogenase